MRQTLSGAFSFWFSVKNFRFVFLKNFNRVSILFYLILLIIGAVCGGKFKDFLMDFELKMNLKILAEFLLKV